MSGEAYSSVKLVLNRKLEYLIALAKEGHFARAAAACHVSQPTLSPAIQEFEAELGVSTVKRGQRYQGLTREGELVVEAARRMAAERDRLRQKLRDRRSESLGTLRIGVLGSAIPLLKSFTVPFRQRLPRVNLSIMVQSQVAVQQAFDESTLDIAITYAEPQLRRRCRIETLYTEQYELVLRRGTALSGRKSVTWAEVPQLPLCLLSPDGPIFGSRESEVLRDILAITPHIVTNAIWLVMDHVRTGEWASVLPRPVTIMIAGDKELEAIPLAAAGKPSTVVIAIPRREPVSPIAREFFELANSESVRRTLDACLGRGQDEPMPRLRRAV